MKLLKVTSVIFFLVTISFACNKKNETAKDVIANYLNRIDTDTVIDYQSFLKAKFIGRDDTLTYKTHCILIKDKTDTILGGQVWIDNDSTALYYDGKNIYHIEHKEKKITRYFPEKGQEWAITSSMVGSTRSIYYLHEEKLNKYLEDTTATHTIKDTVINDKNLFKIHFRFKDEPPVSNQTTDIFIDKESSLISKIISIVMFQGDYQYKEHTLSKIRLNYYTPDSLRKRFKELKNANYIIEDYVAPTKEDYALLENGTKAPDISGTYYDNGKSFRLSDFKGKFVLIDFWYKDCFPCIMAVPRLSELNTKYKDKGLLVFGLNPFNDNEKDRKRLPRFIEENKMNYPIVFIDQEDAKKYNVRAYPTFYLIDKSGKIRYSHLGFGDSTSIVIDSVLNALIK